MYTSEKNSYLADVADLAGGDLDPLGGRPDPGVVNTLAHVGLDFLRI